MLEHNGNFSTGQIDLMIKEASSEQIKAPQSHSWTNADYIKGFTAKAIGTAKSLLFTRKKLVPLPAESTIRKNFRFMFVLPGCIIQPVMTYLKSLMPTLKPVERLAKLAFDETKIKEVAEYDRKLDYAVMAHSQVQVISINGIIGQKFFQPIYMDFDIPVNKELYIMLIKALYSIECKVVITTCDQTGKYIGLGTQL